MPSSFLGVLPILIPPLCVLTSSCISMLVVWLQCHTHVLGHFLLYICYMSSCLMTGFHWVKLTVSVAFSRKIHPFIFLTKKQGVKMLMISQLTHNIWEKNIHLQNAYKIWFSLIYSPDILVPGIIVCVDNRHRL
jgi:hypothetical protein